MAAQTNWRLLCYTTCTAPGPTASPWLPACCTSAGHCRRPAHPGGAPRHGCHCGRGQPGERTRKGTWRATNQLEQFKTTTPIQFLIPAPIISSLYNAMTSTFALLPGCRRLVLHSLADHSLSVRKDSTTFPVAFPTYRRASMRHGRGPLPPRPVQNQPSEAARWAALMSYWMLRGAGQGGSQLVIDVRQVAPYASLHSIRSPAAASPSRAPPAASSRQVGRAGQAGVEAALQDVGRRAMPALVHA